VRLGTAAEYAHLVDVLFMAHPSALAIPRDIKGIRKPTGVAVGSKDNWMNSEQVREMEAVLKGNGVVCEVVVYEGAGHGFSVRIDRKNPKQAEQAVLAEEQAVAWFTRCFAEAG
jgi:dienelactone hydrolase